MTAPRFSRDTTSLTSDTYNFYSRLQFEAATTLRYLGESWLRLQRHNRAIERAALWCALQLDPDCREAVTGDVLSALPASIPAATRYEVHGAVHTLAATMPLTIDEQLALTTPGLSSNPRFADGSAIAQQDLVERWHDWLWSDEVEGSRYGARALGSSAIYAEGCSHLVEAVPVVLGWSNEKPTRTD